MKKLFGLLITSIIVCSSAKAQNILLQHSNVLIDFSKLDTTTITESVETVIKNCDEKIAGIIKASGKQTVANTLTATDWLSYELGDLGSKLQLIANTSTDDALRNTAFAAGDKLSLYMSNVYLNEPLYKALKKFSLGKKAALTASQNKYISDVIITFEKNGMKLNETGRQKLEAINKKLIALGNQFDRNIAESKDSLSFTAAELEGVPATAMNAWKREGDKYVVTVNGPNNTSISENAVNADTRKAIFMSYNNRAYPKNIEVLDSLLYYRNELAKQLGFSSYAAYSVVDKMAGKPSAVWAFENDLEKKLTPLVKQEIKTMTALKHQLYPGNTDSLFAWDYAYCQKKLLNSKYQLNTDEVKEYFEMNNTLQGMFAVYQKLLNIEIKETTGVPVWFDKVKTYEMWKDGVKTGEFYLDLYPRANKYTHFACFPISQYRKENNAEVLPTAALVCNFPEGNAGQPSLLKHSDVTTLFHEFGHLVHWLLCHPAISSQNAFGTKGDFIEAPSQFLENWCWEYDALKLFAKNYKTGKPLPLSLFTKMKQAQLVNAGGYTMRQVSLGTTDFTFEDKYNETKAIGIIETSKKTYSLVQMPFPEGSHFICGFTHLNGYAANYYGYQWSKVYAQDMFSVFKKKGVMDKATGIRYRKTILENGSSIPEIKIVEQFLGRKSNTNAYLQSIGVKK
ncbi:MAG: M3 family metallopeptidase [Bacteroidota bacterium]